MKKRVIIKLCALVLAIAMPFTTVFFAFAESSDSKANEAYSTDVKYDSPDINELTGMGKEPEDISVSAGTKYMEKAWYEYVTYSDKAVASYRLTDDSRLLFYDPYTYTNSMIMDVSFDATTTEFDTMSSYEISKTITKTISSCVSSTETDSKATQTSGRDVTHTDVDNGGSTKTIYNHTENVNTSGTIKEYTDYEYDVVDYVTDSSTIVTSFASETEFSLSVVNPGASETVVIGGGTEDSKTENKEWVLNKSTNTTDYGSDYKTTTSYSGESTVEDNTNSITDGWTELSARVTKTIGSSRTINNSWSEEESTTITKTYAATHFASDGVTPLPWAIVHYEVQMPMKCVMQVKNSGEWISVSTIYTLLTTVKGTCRAWMQNGQVYYEDWGSGEPVVASDFWGQFLTKEQLMNAYSNKLYPVGGED